MRGIEPAVLTILLAVGVVELEAGELRVRLKQAEAGADRRHFRAESRLWKAQPTILIRSLNLRVATLPAWLAEKPPVGGAVFSGRTAGNDAYGGGPGDQTGK